MLTRWKLFNSFLNDKCHWYLKVFDAFICNFVITIALYSDSEWLLNFVFTFLCLHWLFEICQKVWICLFSSVDTGPCIVLLMAMVLFNQCHCVSRGHVSVTGGLWPLIPHFLCELRSVSVKINIDEKDQCWADSVGLDYYLLFIQSHIFLADLVGNMAETSLLTAKQLKMGE